ncbi:MAG: DUF1524 domain-containing protein [Rhodothermaceae bacterium]|nr:DUF1524 domain-containing protein [Rhodothermaceae bacterium]
MRYLIALFALLLVPAVYGQGHGLTVSPENRCGEYNSRDYSYSPTVEASIINRQGGIYSPYNLECFQDRGETDIEHIVARSEAHDSGLCAASVMTRKRFAQDLDNLTLAAPNLNRRIKVAKDVAEWMPTENKCWYVNAIIKVKRKYGLTVDQRESDVLNEWLGRCQSFDMVKPRCSTVSTPRRSGKCGPYSNCTALRRDHPGGVARGHCAYKSRMDRDKDGWACER